MVRRIGRNKICSECKTTKLVGEFGKDLFNKDGLGIYCRECKKQRDEEYYLRNRKKCIQRQREYRRTINGHLVGVFHSMNRRCSTPTTHNYSRYGGRGILNKFRSSKEFISYIVDELKVDPRGLQIDRIDNDKHYEEGNIRFITAKENCANRGEYEKIGA